MTDSKNTILAIILSAVVLLVWQYFFVVPQEKARQILGFPAEWHLRIALSFGYPLEEEKLSAAPKKGGRRTLDEIVHWDRW